MDNANTFQATPIYDQVSAALGFNPVPDQPRSGPVKVKGRRHPVQVSELKNPTPVQQ